MLMSSARSLTCALLLAAGTAISFSPIAAALAGDAAPDAQQSSAKPAAVGVGDLPIKRITLYRSGVASFERHGSVNGNAQVPLKFTAAQVNDILKSLVVIDRSGKGRVAGVSYGSKEPLARRLSAFGLDISDQPSTLQLLGRLRGNQVQLIFSQSKATGTVMGTELRDTIYTGKDGIATNIKLPWVTLLTDAGLRTFNCAEIEGIDVLDKTLAADLAKALALIAEQGQDRFKTVDVSLEGEGTRDIAIAYIQESPVWKTSYRAVLEDNADEKPKMLLQGWAIVENTTDDDWTNVSLSLVSGRPVSFTMNLYEPLYMARPDVPVPMIAGVMPRTFDSGWASADADGMMEMAMNKPSAPPAAAASMPGGMRARGAGADALYAQKERMEAGSALNAGEFGSSGSAAQAVEAGEVFQYQLSQPVTIERQRSAMLQIINASLPQRRISIYSEERGKNPLRGVELTNATGLQLLPGPISVFDSGAYAGDAQINQVAPGDSRFIAYAVDLDVLAEVKPDANNSITRVRIVKGVLESSQKTVRTTTYNFVNKDTKRPRTIVVEHPKSGETLVEPKKPTTETDSTYRFETECKPGAKTQLKVVQETLQTYTVALLSTDMPSLMRLSQQGVASKELLDAYKKAAEFQAAVDAAQTKVNTLKKEREEIDRDQTRIRNNMGSVDRNSDLYKRYVAKLTEQETRVEALTGEQTAAEQAVQNAKAKLDQYVSSLSVD
jgi:hypothetical protein